MNGEHYEYGQNSVGEDNGVSPDRSVPANGKTTVYRHVTHLENVTSSVMAP